MTAVGIFDRCKHIWAFYAYRMIGAYLMIGVIASNGYGIVPPLA